MRFYKKYHFFYITPRGITAVIALLVFIISAIALNTRFIGLAREFAKSRAQYIMTRVVNESVNNCFTDNQSFSELIIMQKDINGNITAVSTDISKINNLKSVLSAKINENLNNYETTQIKVPLSNLLGVGFFSAVGPKIPLNVMPLADMHVEFSDKFTAAGINQTKFEIILKIKTNLLMIMPILNEQTSVSSEIPIAQTVIVGIVPDSYTNVDTKEPGGDETLNLLD